MVIFNIRTNALIEVQMLYWSQSFHVLSVQSLISCLFNQESDGLGNERLRTRLELSWLELVIVMLAGNNTAIWRPLVKLPRKIIYVWVCVLDCDILDDGLAAVDCFLLVLKAHLFDEVQMLLIIKLC